MFSGGAGDIVTDVTGGVAGGEETLDVQIPHLYSNKTELVEKNLHVKELKAPCSYISKSAALRNIWILTNYYTVKQL